MPRAENRKRPANMLGNVRGSGGRNVSHAGEKDAHANGTSSKKQDLLEKMRQLQERKKSDSSN